MISNRSIVFSLFIFPVLILLYFEPVSIGKFSFGFVWKSIFLIIIGTIVFFSATRVSTISRINLIAYLIAFKFFLYANFDGDWLANIGENSKYFSLPLILHLLHLRKTNSRENISELCQICVALSLSCIPFILGLIEPMGKGYNLALFGVESDGFVGIFQGPHSAGITLALSAIFLASQLQSIEIRHKYILLFSAGISIIAVYLTYVRTAWLMCLVSILLWIVFGKDSKIYHKKITVIFILIVGLSVLFTSSNLLQMRLTGNTIYSEEVVTIASVSSGRLSFWWYSILDWLESGSLAMLIGSGHTHALIDMKARVGVGIPAHNIFIDTLHASGLIGLLLLMLFVKEAFSLVKSSRECANYLMYKVFLFAYMIYFFLQGTNFFLVDVIFAYVITSCMAERSNKYQWLPTSKRVLVKHEHI
jgi:hypothetical protein